MGIEVKITSEEIAVHRPRLTAPTLGAFVEFFGVVRQEDGGKTIVALEYEAYVSMAERQIRRLLSELVTTPPSGLSACVIHRIGVVPVGEAAIYVSIATKHRAEAFALMAGFMDRLKQDVPIWKVRALTAVQLPRAIPS